MLPRRCNLSLQRSLILSLLIAAILTLSADGSAVIWSGAGTNTAGGFLNASLIRTTTGSNGVVYSNVNGQGYDIVVTTSGLVQDGAGTLPWNNTPTWWFEGGAASSNGGSIPYSTVTFRFYKTGTTTPFGLTGIHFRFENAKSGERFRNFGYWNAGGAQFDDPYAISFTDPAIFSYSSGAPAVYPGDSSADTGIPYTGGTLQGDCIDVNMAAMAISGFTFQTGRTTSNAGSPNMTGLGANVVSTGELLIQSGLDQNVSAGPNFVSTASLATLTPTTISEAISSSDVSILTGTSQNIVINEDIGDDLGQSLAVQATQNIVSGVATSSTGALTTSLSDGDAGTISLTAGQSVLTGHIESIGYNGAGGGVTINAGANIGVTSGIDTSSVSDQGGDINFLAQNGLAVDSVRTGGGGSVVNHGIPGNITLTAGGTMTVGAVYADSGPGYSPQILLTATSITLGEPGGMAGDVEGSLYLQKPAPASAAAITVNGTLLGTANVFIDSGTGSATLDGIMAGTGQTSILSGAFATGGNSLAKSDLILENTSSLVPGVTAGGGYVAVNSLTVGVNASVNATLTNATTYDQVQAAGAANLNGIFNLAVAPGFTPAIGEVFQVLTFATGAAGFGSYGGMRLSDRVLQPVLTGSSLSLVTSTIPTGASQPLQSVPAAGLGVMAGGYYNGLATTLQTAGNLLAATIIDGTASQAATVTMSLAATATAGIQPQGSLGGVILDLQGTGTDKIVVQVDYNEAAAIATAGDERNLFLASSDGTVPFANAVLANTNLPGETNTPTEFFRAYNPATDFHLGYYGVDTVNNRVWAVVDYSDFFGVGAQNIPALETGPISATEPVTGILATSATLSALVNPNGFGTSFVFESGTSPTFAGATMTPAVWNGTTAGFVPVSYPVTSLMPATLYYYRVDGITTSGTEYGGIFSFVTLTDPMIGVTGWANVMAGGATLNAFVDPQGYDTAVDYQYGTTTGYGSSTTPQDIGNGTSQVLVTGTPAGLAPDTTYHYRIVSNNSMGTDYSSDQVFMNGPTYTVNPATVTGTSVAFSASVNPYGFAGPGTNKTNVLASWQYGLAAGSYTLATAAQPAGTGISAVPVSYIRARSGLQPAIYHYRLVISSTVGIGYGPDQIFSVEPPTATYAVPSVTSTGGILSLTINPNGFDTSVSIQYGLTTAYGGTVSAGDIGSGFAPVSVNPGITGLTANTAYHYRIVTTNILGTFNGPDQTFATAALFGTAAIASRNDVAPGIPGGKFSTFGDPAINDSDHSAFQAVVTGSAGSGIVTGNNSGIWADIGTSGRTLIARTGTAAPGYTPGSTVGTFSVLSDPVFANDDAAAFLGTLSVGGTVAASNNIGIWATTSGALALVARLGDNAPDANGTVSPSGPVFASLLQYVLPDQGGVVIRATLRSGTPSAPAPGGIISTDNQGIWAVDTDGRLKQIVCTGQVLIVNGNKEDVSGLTIFNVPPASTGQTRHFNKTGDLEYKAAFTDGSSSLVKSVSNSNPAAFVSTKDTASGIAAAKFSIFGDPSINNSDHSAFQAVVTGSAGSGIVTGGNSGIWTDKGTSGRTLIARTGTAAPGYTPGSTVGTFSVLSDPVFANDDAAAFLGTLSVSGTVTKSNNIGIWATTSGALALVARLGDNAPDATGTVSPGAPVFASLTQFVLPDQGGVVIRATLKSGTPSAPAPGGVISTNNQGIWAVDTDGLLKQIIRTGQALTVNGSAKIISALTIFNAPPASTGQTRHFNHPGDLIYKATFTDGSTSIVQSVLP